jgi:serine phosphatase RsbU (regulator of sigma subunit)
MSLRYKFVLPVNVILLVVLSGSLAWEWYRQQATGLALVEARLDEEARFVRAAYHTYGPSPQFEAFLRAFCHASNAAVSPEHQVALVGADGAVLAGAAEHARHPADPGELAAAGEGSWAWDKGPEPLLVRVLTDGPRRIVVAESTRGVSWRVRERLESQAIWFAGAGVLILGTTNLIMRNTVLRPLKRIGRAVRKLEQGQLGIELESPGRDELGTLAIRFNAMSRALAAHAESARRELEAAREVQVQMLPPAHLELGCLEVASCSLPRGLVGGDVCDVQLLSGGRVGLLVADLAGHDVAAALHTAMLRAFAWQEAEDLASPGEVLARLNRRLCRNLPGERFATAFFAIYDPTSRVLSWANGGHPPALLRQAPLTRELEPTGPILGILPEAIYGQGEWTLRAGDRVAIFSDGLTEAPGATGQLWGADGIARILSTDGVGSTERAARILEDVSAFRGGAAAQDDVTLLLVEVLQEPPSPESLRSDATDGEWRPGPGGGTSEPPAPNAPLGELRS